MNVSSEIIFVRLLIPLITGICCFYSFESSNHLYVVASITSLFFLILLGINLCYKTLQAYRFKPVTGILFFLFFLSFGATLALIQKDPIKPHYFVKHKTNALKIWIADEPQLSNGTLRFTANVTRAFKNQQSYPVCGKLLLAVKLDSPSKRSYGYGDEFIIKANITSINPSYNPGEFDFKNWLASKNTYLQTFIVENKIIKTGSNQGKSIIKYALELRKKQIEVYRKLIKDEEAFAVASTLILGYRADLSNETLSSYSKTGTIHALSVSGMHVGIIYVVLNWLMRFMDQNRKLKTLKIVLIFGLIWFYSLLTGFSPSVLRSALMLSIYILAKSFNKHTNGFNILAFTAFCLLIYNPFLIWDVGFQLSFLAVLGLIYLHPKIHKWFFFKPRWADWIWSSVALSLAAQIATFPLSVYYFHQFPMYFIFSNLFILIPITLLMYLGICILLFKIYFFASIFEWLIIFMNDGLKWIAHLPFSGVHQIWIDKIQLTILSLALIIGLIGLSFYKKGYILISTSLLLIFQCSLTFQTIAHKRQKKIVFFTLQKGYCVAFVQAESAIILSNLSTYERTFQFYIQPALDQLQTKNIQIINWESKVNLPYFKKENHQINFNGYRILMIDSSLNNRIIGKNLSFNTIWFHKNPKKTFNEIRKSITFKSVVIDATNYTSNLKNDADEAKKFQIQFHILKKNKAYLIDLNNKE